MEEAKRTKKSIVRKGLVFTVIVLFVGTSVLSSIISANDNILKIEVSDTTIDKNNFLLNNDLEPEQQKKELDIKIVEDDLRKESVTYSEEITILEDGYAQLDIMISVSSKQLMELYMESFGISEVILPIDMEIPINTTRIIEIEKDGGIIEVGQIKPVREIFYDGIREEQKYLFGMHITEFKSSRIILDETQNELQINIKALAQPYITGIVKADANLHITICGAPNKYFNDFLYSQLDVSRAMLLTSQESEVFEKKWNVKINLPEESQNIKIDKSQGMFDFGDGSSIHTKMDVESSTVFFNEIWIVTEKHFQRDDIDVENSFTISFSLPKNYQFDSGFKNYDFCHVSFGDYSWGWDFDWPIFSLTGNDPFEYSVDVNLYLILDGNLHVDLGEHCIWNEINITAGLNVSVDISGEWSINIPFDLGIFSGFQYSWRGSQPLLFSLHIEPVAELYISASGEASIYINPEAGFYLKAGIDLDFYWWWPFIEFKPIFEFQPYSSFDYGYQLDGVLTVRPSLGFAVSVLLFEIIGPRITPEIYLEGTIEYDSIEEYIYWHAILGFDLKVGVQFTRFFHWNWPKPLLDIPLNEWSGESNPIDEDNPITTLHLFPEVDGWTGNRTRFWFSAVDSNASASGINRTMYRIRVPPANPPFLEFNHSIEYYIDFPFPSGYYYDAYSIDYYSVDDEGNSEEIHYDAIDIELVPPISSFSISEPYSGNHVIPNYTCITLEGADNDTGWTVYYRYWNEIDGWSDNRSGYENTPVEFYFSENDIGTCYLEWFAIDSVLNSEGIEIMHNETFIVEPIIYVDDDYNETTPGWNITHFNKIQDGIDIVNEVGLVYVSNGTYYENVIIDKKICLVGEDKNTTIIDGGGNGNVVYVSANWVSISGFTIQRSGTTTGYYGMHITSNYNTISDNIVRWNNWTGVRFISSNNNIISSNNIHDNRIGLIIASTSINNSISDNTIHNNTYEGIRLLSNNNTISSNTISSNGLSGIYLSDSNINKILKNNIISNTEDGIYLVSSNNNNISENYISENWNGLRLWSSNNNIIMGNKFCQINYYGVSLSQSSNNNQLFHNNYINNAYNSWDECINTWDDGYPSGGNYWDDYIGEDNNGDGIGDTQYNISGGSNQDLYPLMYPWYPTHPDTVYVNDDYNISTPGFGYDRFNRIQYGINEVQENGTIFVFNGTYYENVIIDKKICLVGEDKNTTVIDGGGSGDIISVSADYTYITRLSMINGDTGIYLYSSSNNQITNCTNSNNDYGIYLFWSSNNNTITNCTASNNIYGIVLPSSSNNNTITNCTASNNSFGIYLYSSSNNQITNCTTNNNFEGIYLYSSLNNQITNCTNSNNSRGIRLLDSSNNSITNCIASNNNYAGVLLGSSSNNQITNCTNSNNSRGIRLLNSSNNTITNCIASNNNEGIHLYSSSNNNIITNCMTSNNNDYGIQLHSNSNYNNISENAINSNNDDGIHLYSSYFNTISNNNILNNTNGIYLDDSDNNTVSSNNISNNYDGIFFYGNIGIESNYNNIIGNTISLNNDHGVYLPFFSSNNLLYHNNFINNTDDAHDQNYNLWDNGYPSGGNYWSDYLGSDDYYGPNQNIPGSDGIGDTPHDLIPYNQDLYPLMNPWNGTPPITPFNYVYIDDDYSSSTPGWQYDHFDSIQDGIDVVNENGTVYVYNGTYYENVVVNKTINLVGEDKNSTIIDGGGNGDVVYVSADYTYITRLSMINGDHGIIYLSSSSNNSITNCTASNNNYDGIRLYSSNNQITNCTASNNNYDGILLLFYSDNNIVTNCTASNNNEYGIRLYSSNNQIVNCTASNNNQDGIILSESSNNSITNCTASNNSYDGIRLLFYSDNNVVTNCTASNNNYDGIFLSSSSNNQITNCTASNNNHDGINLYYSSSNNALSGNYISGNWVNIFLRELSNYNIIKANNITDGYHGIDLWNSINNSISGNNILGHVYGIDLISESNHNHIFTNNIAHNVHGIYLDDSSNNHIYHNNFINNTLGNTVVNSTNIWDNGYPSGGNYWDDYAGVDNYSGPNQDVPGPDGIGDTTYIISSGDNQDNYPLFYPFDLCYIKNLSNNWNFVSLPFNQSINKTDIIIWCNGTYYSWQEAIEGNIILGYVYGWNRIINVYEGADALEPGYGYWLYAYEMCKILVQGVDIISSDNFITNVLTGWNILGIPYYELVNKENLTVYYNETEYTWQEAVNNNIVLGFIYEWNEKNQIYESTDILHPRKACWMYAYYNCTLLRPVT